MSNKTSSLGVISINEMYTLNEFKKRMSLTDTAMRELRRKGLVVYRLGKRAWVNGAEAINFMVQNGVGSNEGESCQSSIEVLGVEMDLSGDGPADATFGEDKKSA